MLAGVRLYGWTVLSALMLTTTAAVMAGDRDEPHAEHQIRVEADAHRVQVGRLRPAAMDMGDTAGVRILRAKRIVIRRVDIAGHAAGSVPAPVQQCRRPRHPAQLHFLSRPWP